MPVPSDSTTVNKIGMGLGFQNIGFDSRNYCPEATRSQSKRPAGAGRVSLFASKRARLLQSLDGGIEPVAGSSEACYILELVIADAPIEVEAVAHGVCRVLGGVDQLFDQLGIDSWSWCVVHD